jgi:hypothetical protein
MQSCKPHSSAHCFPLYNRISNTIIFSPAHTTAKVHIWVELCRAIQKDVNNLKLAFTFGSIESKFLVVLQALDEVAGYTPISRRVASQNFASMSV